MALNYKLHAPAANAAADLSGHFLRGNESLAAGDYRQAVECYHQVLAVSPDLAEAHNNLGVALKRQQQFDDAGVAFQRAVAARPDFVDAYVNLGDTLRQLDRLEEARICLQAALDIDPNCPAAYNNLGIVQRRLGDNDAAIQSFQQALRLQPNHASAADNLGNVLAQTNRLEEAEVQFAQAACTDAQALSAHNHMGLLRQRQGRLREAEQEFQTAIQLDASSATAHLNLGVLYLYEGRVKEAQYCFRQTLQLQPQFIKAHSNLLISLGYDPGVDLDELFDEHLRWQQQHAADIPHITTHANSPQPRRRLRIGYISIDFRRHPVASFIEPILKLRNTSEVEVVCYSDVPAPDAVTERLEKLADEWHNVAGMADAELVERIQQDGIDVLVDLAGHTAGNRLLVFAQKPAPVQFSMLGYGNTTGLTTIDCRITDAICDSPEEPCRHTETLVRIPAGSFTFAPPQSAPDVQPPPALKNRYVTFGSCNKLAKIGPDVIAVWAEILAAIPNSRLRLKNGAFGDEKVRQRFHELFRQHHIPAERIQFQGFVESEEEHLAAYHHVDVALDPFPYTGATTTCEALWMGVPVVTLRGANYVGRMSAGILNQTGYGYLTAASKPQYISTAIGIASDVAQLSEIRNDLRQQLQSSSLCQPEPIVAEIESAYRTAWQHWCQTQVAP
ncbi:TPR repeat-containing protein YrrB [Symmachiella macrocystis]|uniref:protein O-GlcNAc transferase n=1 Tax=Symmachiella macrocystis TaxID=2527985 RepID=A0A5C6BLX4_9PLAN|nr:tetratricopeptide repeat protein [Symmachiella macrocystis]TWU13130.1 TPR repeat-containing protein YrrB [Symmachiella macrocystis]